jgi:hypothetical protein
MEKDITGAVHRMVHVEIYFEELGNFFFICLCFLKEARPEA